MSTLLWACGTIAAVLYGVGMWYVGITMGIDLQKRNPGTTENRSKD